MCEKFCINFFDQSTNNPTSWLWLFEQGSPSSSTDQNPVQICYQTPGIYDVTLITTNANGSDTTTFADYVTVNPTPSIPVITQNGFVLTSSSAYGYQWQFNAADIAGATSQSFTIAQTGLYTVVISDSNGCQNSATVYVGITSINEILTNQNIRITPNPSDGKFTIEFYNELNAKSISIAVKNTIGQEVFNSQDKISSMDFIKTIDLAKLPRGVYFVELSDGYFFIRKMIMIVR